MLAYPDWPILERDAGSDMDEPFFTKWKDRDRALVQRATPAEDHSRSGAPSASWTALGASFRWWFPPWAGILVAPVRLKLDFTAPSGAIQGWVSARMRFGDSTFYYSTEAKLLLQCANLEPTKPYQCGGPAAGADGTPESGNGQWFTKTIRFYLPQSYYDSERAGQFEWRSSTSDLQTVAVETRRSWRYEKAA